MKQKIQSSQKDMQNIVKMDYEDVYNSHFNKWIYRTVLKKDVTGISS